LLLENKSIAHHFDHMIDIISQMNEEELT